MSPADCLWENWSRQRDLNPWPTVYELVAGLSPLFADIRQPAETFTCFHDSSLVAVGFAVQIAVQQGSPSWLLSSLTRNMSSSEGDTLFIIEPDDENSQHRPWRYPFCTAIGTAKPTVTSEAARKQVKVSAGG